MENLIINLIETLIQRIKSEVARIVEFAKEDCKDIILISSGKIFELDSVISDLDEMINYIEKTKKTQ